MLAFSNDYYGFIFRATQSVELFCAYVKKAENMKNGKIYRKSVKRPEQDIYALIKPTNSYDTCQIIVYRHGKPERSARAWNPTADDLAANDWECLEDEF